MITWELVDALCLYTIYEHYIDSIYSMNFA